MTSVKSLNQLDKKAKELIQTLSNKQFTLLMNNKLEDFFKTTYIYRDFEKSKQLNKEQLTLIQNATVEQNHYFHGITYHENVTRFTPKNNNPSQRAEDCLNELSSIYALLLDVSVFSNLLNHVSSMMEFLLGIDFSISTILSDIKDYETRKKVLNNKEIQKQTEKYSKLIPKMLKTIERTKNEKPEIYNSVDKDILKLFEYNKKSYELFLIKEPLNQRVERITKETIRKLE